MNATEGAKIRDSETDRQIARDQKHKSDLILSIEKSAPIIDLVNEVREKVGIPITLIPHEQIDRVYGYLTVGNTQYGCIVDTEGCAIYRHEMYPTQDRKYSEYEGRKTFSESLGAIAMIAGYHYPRKAEEIDHLLRSRIA
jgi:hypothetical protein